MELSGALEMATDSGGELIQAVITCEGDMKDPQFPLKFGRLVQRLKTCLFEGKFLVNLILESWSVGHRTLSLSDSAP